MRAAGAAALLQGSTGRWLQLLILSIALAALSERLGLPASRLLGKMSDHVDLCEIDKALAVVVMAATKSCRACSACRNVEVTPFKTVLFEAVA